MEINTLIICICVFVSILVICSTVYGCVDKVCQIKRPRSINEIFSGIGDDNK